MSDQMYVKIEITVMDNQYGYNKDIFVNKETILQTQEINASAIASGLGQMITGMAGAAIDEYIAKSAEKKAAENAKEEAAQ